MEWIGQAANFSMRLWWQALRNDLYTSFCRSTFWQKAATNDTIWLACPFLKGPNIFGRLCKGILSRYIFARSRLFSKSCSVKHLPLNSMTIHGSFDRQDDHMNLGRSALCYVIDSDSVFVARHIARGLIIVPK